MSLDKKELLQSEKSQELDSKVDVSRRSFAKVGAIAPVIMTMASKPVFGAVQCASAMVSTTHTSHSPQYECWGGLSPGFWLTPHGKVNILNGGDVFRAWRRAIGHAVGGSVNNNNAYGSLPSACPADYQNPSGNCKNSWGNQWDHYVGGAVYGLTPFDSFNVSKPIREVLGENPGDTLGGWHYIAAWLNLHFAAAMGIHYVLNAADFLTAVNNGTLPGIVSTLYDQ